MKSNTPSSESSFSSNDTERERNSRRHDRIILGIDPGTNLLGYGLIAVEGQQVELLAMGAIDLRKVKDVYLKLGRIYERMIALIEEFHPDELAVEAPFFGKNVQSMLKLGRAQGVVIAAAIARHIPICEYAPTQIKQTITGTGAASKEQVARLLQRLLKLSDEGLPPFLDATDAVAAAYCHHVATSRKGVKGQVAMLRDERSNKRKKTASWADFVQDNLQRVHR